MDREDKYLLTTVAHCKKTLTFKIPSFLLPIDRLTTFHTPSKERLKDDFIGAERIFALHVYFNVERFDFNEGSLEKVTTTPSKPETKPVRKYSQGLPCIVPFSRPTLRDAPRRDNFSANSMKQPSAWQGPGRNLSEHDESAKLRQKNRRRARSSLKSFLFHGNPPSVPDRLLAANRVRAELRLVERSNPATGWSVVLSRDRSIAPIRCIDRPERVSAEAPGLISNASKLIAIIARDERAPSVGNYQSGARLNHGNILNLN